MANTRREKRKAREAAEAQNQNPDQEQNQEWYDDNELDDEFYTTLPDIENELAHYKGHFNNACVYCNCDDPLESNFFIYFVKHFKELGLRRLITTCYDGSPVAGTQLLLPFPETKKDPTRTASKIDITDVKDFSITSKDGKINFKDVENALLNGTEKAQLEKLRGTGDFRSEECVELLKEADIIVTNPPFTCFSEYVNLLMKHNKKFLILGNQNEISYTEIFPLIREGKMWLGYKVGDMNFRVPKYYKDRKDRSWIENGQRWRSIGNICWFTNLEISKQQELFNATEPYAANKYPKYDNYDGIEVDTVKKIPKGYSGKMGVPLSFLAKYNPEQFTIVGLGNGLDHFTPNKEYVNPMQHSTETGETKKGGEINRVLAVKTKTPPTWKKKYYTCDNVKGYLYAPFARLIIQRRRS